MKNSSRNIYAAAAKVVGLLLKVRKLNNESNYRLLEQLSFILKWHNSQNLQNTFIYYKNIILKLLIKQAMIPNITKFDFIYLELKAAEILDIIIHKMILQPIQKISNRQQFLPSQMLDNTTAYNWLKQTNTFALPTLSTQTKRIPLMINVDNINKKSKK
ncbi:unnamed protein product [Rotaria sp. Silwood2]|nr:unnamed protein product [Rotaria sp. Silwood2]